MKVVEYDFNLAGKSIYENRNIIYGAGYNGKFLYEILKKLNVEIEGFYDDDTSRWGDKYCGKKILSKEELMEYDRYTTNIFISSMYVGQIGKKIEKMGFIKAFSVIEILLQKDSDIFRFIEYQNNKNYIKDLNQLINQSYDADTRKYFQVIKKTVLAGKAIRDIVDLCCSEKQYLLDYFIGRLNGANFIDAGAYTGDTVREIMNENIHPAGVYCFEADYGNYVKLKESVGEYTKDVNVICENYALWDSKTELGMKFSNYNARIDLDSDQMVVETRTIDDYFENIKVGFIKMDIEGAERWALRGGMNTIKRDRPILAISIYHGLDDIVGIPKMLMKELKKYIFIVRHHSYTYSETVLYGMPEELDIL